MTPALLDAVVRLLPDEWLLGMNAAHGDPRTADDWRARYIDYLRARLDQQSAWQPEVHAA